MTARRLLPRIVIDDPDAVQRDKTANVRARVRDETLANILSAARRGDLDRDVVLAAIDGPQLATVAHTCGPIAFAPGQQWAACPSCGNYIARS